MDKTFCLAFVGHADALPWGAAASRSGGVQFTAVIDPDLDRGLEAARVLGAPQVAGSLAELLEQQPDGFSAVLIGSDAFDGESAVLAAATAGKQVLAKLPLVASRERLEQLADACTQAGTGLAIESRLRVRPAYAAVKERLDSGRLGEPGLLRIHCWRPGAAALDTSGPPAAQELLEQIDLACWLFERRPRHVYAVGSPAAGDADRYRQLHLGFPGGGMALIDTVSSLPGTAGYASLSMIGSEGAAYVDDHHDAQLLLAGSGPAALATPAGQLEYVALLRRFVTLLASGQATVNVEHARLALELAEAAERSLATSHALHWNGERYDSA